MCSFSKRTRAKDLFLSFYKKVCLSETLPKWLPTWNRFIQEGVEKWIKCLKTRAYCFRNWWRRDSCHPPTTHTAFRVRISSNECLNGHVPRHRLHRDSLLIRWSRARAELHNGCGLLQISHPRHRTWDLRSNIYRKRAYYSISYLGKMSNSSPTALFLYPERSTKKGQSSPRSC